MATMGIEIGAVYVCKLRKALLLRNVWPSCRIRDCRPAIVTDSKQTCDEGAHDRPGFMHVFPGSSREMPEISTDRALAGCCAAFGLRHPVPSGHPAGAFARAARCRAAAYRTAGRRAAVGDRAGARCQ